MKESEARKVVDGINEIYKVMPLAKAVENPELERLQQLLRASEWRTVVDEFQIVGDVPYGKARLVRKDSPDCIAIYGRDK